MENGSSRPARSVARTLVISFFVLEVLNGFVAAHAMNAQTSSDLKRAEECYRLEGRVPGFWGEADLIMLTNRDPVELEAELFIDAPLPASLREQSRSIRWVADAGTIQKRASGQGLTRAAWTLPPYSRAIKVHVEARVVLEPTVPRSAVSPYTITKSVEFTFMVPVSSVFMVDGVIDRYEIGEYPNPSDPATESHWPRTHPERYQVPDFFYQVDAASKSLKISPHLTLGHFAIDFPWKSLGMPQYIALDMHLVQKLEDLLALIQKDGRFPATGLTPIYGFRPPSFNRLTIEQDPANNLKVLYSMHQYGRALDFIIDEDNDLVLDDVNGDGRHDIYDAQEIMYYVNDLDRQYREDGDWNKVGGAGVYDHHDFSGRVQSAYVHVDTRGFVEENGWLIRWAEPEDFPLKSRRDQ